MSLHYVKYQHTSLPSWQKVRISLHESRHLHFPQRAAPRAGKEAGFPLWTFSPLRDEILLPVVLSGFLVFNLSSHTEQNESLESVVVRWHRRSHLCSGFPTLIIDCSVKVWPPFRPFSRNFPCSLEFLTSFLLLQGKGWVWKCHFPETSLRKAALLSLVANMPQTAQNQSSQKEARGGALSAFSRDVKSCFREIIHRFFVWVLMSLTFYFPSGLTSAPPPSQRNARQCSGDTR